MSLEDFDWSDFWNNEEYSREYAGRPVTDEMIRTAEKKLGYKLPESYLQMLRVQNGGTPKNDACRTSEPTWAEDHCTITGIFGIDPEKTYSLLGPSYGNGFWIEECGYPDIGLYICDTPSAGHDMLALDYTICGRDGEPRVVHIDQECDYETTVVADTFAAFIRKLEPEENFEEE